LAEDYPHIAEMDCNPVFVSASGAVVVDARVRVAPAAHGARLVRAAEHVYVLRHPLCSTWLP
jgi:hypothetical protein